MGERLLTVRQLRDEGLPLARILILQEEGRIHSTHIYDERYSLEKVEAAIRERWPGDETERTKGT